MPRCACATCHVYVDDAWADRTGEVDDFEDAMLDVADHADPILIDLALDPRPLSCLSDSRIRQIAANAGVEGSIVVERVREGKSATFGYNAASQEYEDLVKAGIIDPTKVVRSALQNAASVASLLLTTEAILTDKPEEDKKGPAMPGEGMY